MKMEAITYIVASLLVVISVVEGQANAKTYTALFAFGDTFADTGNLDKSDSRINLVGEPNNAPWRKPYGETVPGTPTGRYSDGRVLTDFYASYLQVEPPVPYSLRNSSNSDSTAGINFAYAGTGISVTFYSTYPNISTQIQELSSLIDAGMVSKSLIASSICLFSIGGNDYTPYLTEKQAGLTTFIPKLIDEFGANLEALYGLGFRSIAVSNLEPVGCLPFFTSQNNYTACNETLNSALSVPHNQQLASKLTALRDKYNLADFIELDLYSAINTLKDMRSIRPCCEGINGSLCGSVDSNGAPLYTVCPSPETALFWDRSHPSDSAWEMISSMLFKSLSH